MYLRPAAGPLKGLRGGSLALRRSTSTVDVEFSGSLLQGEIRPESQLHDGIEAPLELALGARAGLHLPENSFLGMNGFIGFQYGYLTWKYRNSVFAIDRDGYGQEVSRDSIGGFAGFVGLGVRPVQTRVFSVGVNFRVGRRTYLAETTEGFSNDVFRDSWFSQADVELVIRL